MYYQFDIDRGQAGLSSDSDPSGSNQWGVFPQPFLYNNTSRAALASKPDGVLISRWDGMKPHEIPIMDHDTTIPAGDRFPIHPFGPVVPGPEHVNPDTGRYDHNLYMTMVEDRFAVGDGDYSVLNKYQSKDISREQPLASRGGYDNQEWLNRGIRDPRLPATPEERTIKERFLRDLEKRKEEYNRCKERGIGGSGFYPGFGCGNEPGTPGGYTFEDYLKEYHPKYAR